MTERHEITSMLQKEISQNPAIFGALNPGTVEQPGIEIVSVHYFYKSVSGSPLVRPGWFFDVAQQGEAIVDVSVHLVDLVQWICFPGVVLNKTDVEMLQARRWPTVMTAEEFKAVTKMETFPDYLAGVVKDGKLDEYANGEMLYKLKGVHARVVAKWDYKAPEGSGDTHYAILRGTKASVEIKQGEAEKYMPTLYVNAAPGSDAVAFNSELEKVLLNNITYPGLALEKAGELTWKVVIPTQYKVGHEAHFSQVTEQYLEYLKAGKMPEWEVPNMLVKYYTTTEALKLARK
jgi:hypothetical protein